MVGTRFPRSCSRRRSSTEGTRRPPSTCRRDAARPCRPAGTRRASTRQPSSSTDHVGAMSERGQQARRAPTRSAASPRRPRPPDSSSERVDYGESSSKWKPNAEHLWSHSRGRDTAASLRRSTPRPSNTRSRPAERFHPTRLSNSRSGRDPPGGAKLKLGSRDALGVRLRPWSCKQGPREPPRAGADRVREDVVVDRLDAVEDGEVGGTREAHAAPRRRQRSSDGRRRLAEERTRTADLDREQGAKLRRRRHEAERGSITPKRSSSSAGR